MSYKVFIIEFIILLAVGFDVKQLCKIRKKSLSLCINARQRCCLSSVHYYRMIYL